MPTTTQERPPVQFSCYFTRSREGEQFVPEHVIAYVISGTTILDDGVQAKSFSQGDVYFCRRNHLIKFQKLPPQHGEYRSISIYFPQDFLRDFSLEYGYRSARTVQSNVYQQLPSESVLGKYMDSLRSYESILSGEGPASKDLLAVKQKEAILILLNLRPDLKEVLFDFSEPGKIDLESFMVQHYHFNVDLPRFAYLTGRSLSTFKRDFEKIFHVTPSRWLQQRRLEEAYHLLKDKGRAASDIYLDLGFEDLSHFSFAFKKRYGMAPSLI